MKDFWHTLARPFFVLAPMDDVTDVAFRRIIAEYAAPEIPRILYTEFTSADGLVLADADGQTKLRRKISFHEIERPVVAQLFTSKPHHMEQAARMVAEAGFDGLDINMGCPDAAVEKSGSGAALIRTPALARELIEAAQRGFGKPVSVKTRLGYNVDQLEEWLPVLLDAQPTTVTIHARTRKELSLVPARWERIARAVEIRDEMKSEALIIGNGDVRDLADARAKADATKCDGVMLGRAVFGNPWIFSGREDAPTPRERLQALARHLSLFGELVSDVKSYAVMKKHFKAYVSGFDGAKELRLKLMETAQISEAQELLASAILLA